MGSFSAKYVVVSFKHARFFCSTFVLMYLEAIVLKLQNVFDEIIS